MKPNSIIDVDNMNLRMSFYIEELNKLYLPILTYTVFSKTKMFS